MASGYDSQPLPDSSGYHCAESLAISMLNSALRTGWQLSALHLKPGSQLEASSWEIQSCQRHFSFVFCFFFKLVNSRFALWVRSELQAGSCYLLLFCTVRERYVSLRLNLLFVLMRTGGFSEHFPPLQSPGSFKSDKTSFYGEVQVAGWEAPQGQGSWWQDNQ